MTVILLLRFHSEAPLQFTDEDELFAEALGLIFAGFETSGSSLALFLSVLIKHPAELQLLREEIAANSPLRSAQDAARLVRLNAAFNESMRLWPPVIGNVFVAERDGAVLGVPVQRGQQILLNNYACSRDPAVFQEPEQFRPARFLVSTEALGENPDAVKDVPQASKLGKSQTFFCVVDRLLFHKMAFSFGEHSCLGKNLALLEVRMAAAAILSGFDFQFVDPKYEAGYAASRHMVPHPNGDCTVFVKKRAAN